MDENDILEDLITLGALKRCGVDPNSGEPLYSFTPKIKDLMPDLYQEHLNLINSEVMELWEKGYVDLNLLETDPMISLNEKSFDLKEISKLSKEQAWTLSEIKRVAISDNF